MNALQSELAKLLDKRDRIRSRQIKGYDVGTASRARTTSSNAEADRCNERIVWIREEIKKGTLK